MVSAERLFQYSALEPEAPLDSTPPSRRPPHDWPQRGEIVLDDVSFRYSEDTPTVLKSLSCTIRPAEKVSALLLDLCVQSPDKQVGIVGRTGAGKSSLIALLYRLAEPTGGLKIDGVQTTEIGLHDLRKKMSIIPQVLQTAVFHGLFPSFPKPPLTHSPSSHPSPSSYIHSPSSHTLPTPTLPLHTPTLFTHPLSLTSQDPVLFSGSVRYNLDPFEQYQDQQLWDVLDQVPRPPSYHHAYVCVLCVGVVRSS